MNIVDRPLLKETKYTLIGFGLGLAGLLASSLQGYGPYGLFDIIFSMAPYGFAGFFIGRYVDKKKRKI